MNNNQKRTALIILLSMLVGIILGSLLTIGWQTRAAKLKSEFEAFEYGVVSNSLAAENIVWNEYPQFRRVQLSLNGRVKITVPRDYRFEIEDLKDADSLKEVSRTQRHLSDGRDKLYYDEVEYEFQNAEIVSNNAKFFGYPEKDAAYGYKLSYLVDESEVIIGFITPMSNEFQRCTREQSRYWVCAQNPDWGFLMLSKTYIDGDITQVKEVCPTVNLERKAGALFDSVITNKGDSSWSYSADLPSIEVWNQGVWLEVSSPYDSAAMLTAAEPKKSTDLHFPEHVLKEYPYFAPGVYRLVVYGADGTYVSTESFVVE